MANEENRFSARAARYVRVGTNVGAVAARVAGGRLLGRDYEPVPFAWLENSYGRPPPAR